MLRLSADDLVLAVGGMFFSGPVTISLVSSMMTGVSELVNIFARYQVIAGIEMSRMRPIVMEIYFICWPVERLSGGTG